ncbi:MAG: alpha/beta hydrolase [Gordonia sp.]|nr:alpha/beta hydrolase [Gordonia sp. (in: high G+C Gram-positive bacteria)]
MTVQNRRAGRDELTGRFVADEALGVVTAFRENGGRSFHHLGVETARARYEESCARNGLAPDPIATVTDHTIDDTFGVRVYDPRPLGQPSPVLVFIHGGGWVMGSLDTHDSLCRRLATLTGIPVVAVDYRLAPEHRYPAAIDDCRATVGWLSTSTDHDLDPTSLVLVGDSAGGQLAASLAIELTLEPAPLPVLAQVLLYPVTDLTTCSASHRRIVEGFPLVSDTMTWFADLYVGPDNDRARPDLSPLRAEIPTGVPPAFVCTVDNDPLADEGIGYAAALARSGTEVQSVHLAGFAHGLFTSAGIIPRAERVLQQAADFVRSQL